MTKSTPGNLHPNDPDNVWPDDGSEDRARAEGAEPARMLLQDLRAAFVSLLVELPSGDTDSVEIAMVAIGSIDSALAARKGPSPASSGHAVQSWEAAKAVSGGAPEGAEPPALSVEQVRAATLVHRYIDGAGQAATGWEGAEPPVPPPAPLDQSPADDPEIGRCFTEPMEALRFLAKRFRHAGVSEAVALDYARDLEAILGALPAVPPAPEPIAMTDGFGQMTYWREVPAPMPGTLTTSSTICMERAAPAVPPDLRLQPKFDECHTAEPSLHELILRYYGHHFSPEETARYVLRYEAAFAATPPVPVVPALTLSALMSLEPQREWWTSQIVKWLEKHERFAAGLARPAEQDTARDALQDAATELEEAARLAEPDYPATADRYRFTASRCRAAAEGSAR